MTIEKFAQVWTAEELRQLNTTLEEKYQEYLEEEGYEAMAHRAFYANEK